MAFYSIYHGFYVLCKSPGYIGPLLNAGRKDGRTAAFRNTPPPSSFQSIITHCCHCGACVWLFESLGSYFIHGFYILWKSPGYTEPLLNTGRNEERTAAFRNNPPPLFFSKYYNTLLPLRCLCMTFWILGFISHPWIPSPLSPGYIGPLLNANRKDGCMAVFRNTPWGPFPFFSKYYNTLLPLRHLCKNFLIFGVLKICWTSGQDMMSGKALWSIKRAI